MIQLGKVLAIGRVNLLRQVRDRGDLFFVFVLPTIIVVALGLQFGGPAQARLGVVAPGRAMPDCLIAARIANHLERVLRGMGDDAYADQFKGFDWRTEEDAFMDGYHLNAKGGEHVTYARLRAMGTNGFQEPAVNYVEPGGRGESDASPRIGEGQQRGIVSPPEGATAASPAPAATGIIGTKRLYADGRFGTERSMARIYASPTTGTPSHSPSSETCARTMSVSSGSNGRNSCTAFTRSSCRSRSSAASSMPMNRSPSRIGCAK